MTKCEHNQINSMTSSKSEAATSVLHISPMKRSQTESPNLIKHHYANKKRKLILKKYKTLSSSTALNSNWVVIDISNTSGSKLIIKRLNRRSSRLDALSSSEISTLLTSKKMSFITGGPVTGCNTRKLLDFAHTNTVDDNSHDEQSLWRNDGERSLWNSNSEQSSWKSDIEQSLWNSNGEQSLWKSDGENSLWNCDGDNPLWNCDGEQSLRRNDQAGHIVDTDTQRNAGTEHLRSLQRQDTLILEGSDEANNSILL